jgi:hypothetical protein
MLPRAVEKPTWAKFEFHTAIHCPAGGCAFLNLPRRPVSAAPASVPHGPRSLRTTTRAPVAWRVGDNHSCHWPAGIPPRKSKTIRTLMQMFYSSSVDAQAQPTCGIGTEQCLSVSEFGLEGVLSSLLKTPLFQIVPLEPSIGRKGIPAAEQGFQKSSGLAPNTRGGRCASWRKCPWRACSAAD